MKKMLSALMVVAAGSLVSGLASANQITYDHVGVSYVSYGSGSESLTGARLDFSRRVHEQFYLTGSWTRVSDSFSEFQSTVQFNVKVEGNELLFGGGFRGALQDNMDWFVEGGLAHIAIKASVNSSWFGNESFNDDESGVFLSTGLNSRLAPGVEGRVFVKRLQISGESENEIGVLGRFRVMHNLHLTAGLSRISSDNFLRAGISYAF
ncbi:MAG: hypothetical protein JJU10_00365 [Idiomarina sp.]|nr:hypothetical protein [Idiomarina sp.]